MVATSLRLARGGPTSARPRAPLVAGWSSDSGAGPAAATATARHALVCPMARVRRIPQTPRYLIRSRGSARGFGLYRRLVRWSARRDQHLRALERLPVGAVPAAGSKNDAAILGQERLPGRVFRVLWRNEPAPALPYVVAPAPDP